MAATGSLHQGLNNKEKENLPEVPPISMLQLLNEERKNCTHLSHLIGQDGIVSSCARGGSAWMTGNVCPLEEWLGSGIAAQGVVGSPSLEVLRRRCGTEGHYQ